MPNDTQSRIDALEKQIKLLRDQVNSKNFTGSQDFNKFSRFNTNLKVPHYTATPTACEVGEVCEVSGKLRICSAANTWSIVGTQS